MDLTTPLTYVKGVGPARAQQLEAKGLLTVEDLLTYPPFRYEDRTNVKPIARLHVTSRSQGFAIVAIGILGAVVGFEVPAPESRVDRAETRLDEFMPAWQFNEHHTIRIAASPERVFDAIERVRANEQLFHKFGQTCPRETQESRHLAGPTG